MTRTAFLKEFGAEFRKLSNKPMFAALLETIDEEGPARKITGRTENDRLHGAAVLLNSIAGWEELRAWLAGLSTAPDEQFEPEDKFREPEIQ